MKPYNYCRVCGGKLVEEQQYGEKCWVCKQCPNIEYANPTPTVDAVLFDKAGRALLCVRARDPKKGFLNLPGGFMGLNETLEQAIARELSEELGITPQDHGELVYISSKIDDYPSPGGSYAIVVIVVAGKLNRTDFSVADDVESIAWKHVQDIKPEEMAGGESELQQICEAAKKLGISI
jgi:ADP-ribose pyrophosphatase YjhB (NUDIX family)